MQRIITWVCVFLLILIHTIDMELTGYYIGNNFERESFPIMRFTIQVFGIDTALWFSRAIMYVYFFVALINRDKPKWYYFLILVTVLYWVAMIDWLFHLQLANWPLPPDLSRY